MPLVVMRSPGEWAPRFGPSGALGARETVITVGNFDSIHLGHQRILRGVVDGTKEMGALSVVLTFDPLPAKVLRPAQSPPMIATLAQRLADFERLGIDAALVLSFDLELSRLEPEEFVRGILVEQLHMTRIVVGGNFRFGHQQAGDVKLLAELSKRYSFSVEIVPPVVVRGEVVCSTAIRRAVSEGRIGHAARLLGRPFVLTGEIRPGTGQGARLVFPTLNLAAEQELRPRIGVYATETEVAGRRYRCATNVGVRPTFDGGPLTIESHLFGFSETVTSGPMAVHFWKRLREERRFSGPEALRAQITDDLARTRRFFARLDRARATHQKA